MSEKNPENKPSRKLVGRLSSLLSVKSLMTLALTVVFSYMACTNQINQDFMTLYAVIISFYFGTQNQKSTDKE